MTDDKWPDSIPFNTSFVKVAGAWWESVVCLFSIPQIPEARELARTQIRDTTERTYFMAHQVQAVMCHLT